MTSYKPGDMSDTVFEVNSGRIYGQLNQELAIFFGECLPKYEPEYLYIYGPCVEPIALGAYVYSKIKKYRSAIRESKRDFTLKIRLDIIAEGRSMQYIDLHVRCKSSVMDALAVEHSIEKITEAFSSTIIKVCSEKALIKDCKIKLLTK